MTRRLLIVTVLVSTGILVRPGLGGPTSKPQKAGERTPEDEVKKLHEQLIRELKLSKERDAVVRKLLADHRQNIAAWMRKNGPEMAKLQKQIKLVHDGKSTESPMAAKAAAQRLRVLLAEQKKKLAGLLTRLKEVLTEAQLVKARSILSPAPRIPTPPPPFYLLRRLALTDKQRARIKTVRDAAILAGVKEGKTKGDLMRKAWDQIVKEVLTEKDRKKLAELKKASRRRVIRAMLGGVKLTEQQHGKIDKIWEAARKEISKHPEARIDIVRGMYKEILEKVLTPEQRKQAARGGGGHGGPKGGGEREKENPAKSTTKSTGAGG